MQTRKIVGMSPISFFPRYNQRRLAWLGLGLAFFLAMLVLFGRFPATAASPKPYNELTFAPLPEIQVPAYSRYQLDNGIVVYLMPDQELPLVQGMALFRTGDRWEPPDKVGLASLTGEVMRSGGTQTHPAAELNRLLEQRAAAVEAGIGETSGRVLFDALSEDLEPVFGLFAEVIQEPAFAPDQIELGKTHHRGAIQRRNDDPNGILGREFRKLIYGSGSPYARTVEYETLAAISQEDILRFYRQSFVPDAMILGIVGDFDSEVMRSLIQEEFGDWNPEVQGQTPAPPTVAQVHAGDIFFIDQPQLTQSYIRLGHLGGRANDPDFPTLGVLNEILNGMGGRLFNEVRSRQGLAYSVYGVWSAQEDYPGLLVVGGETQSENSVPFIQAVKQELEHVRQEPVSPEELKFAQDSVLNSFVFHFQDTRQILFRLLNYEYYDYPTDFIFQYRQGVEATTSVDVQRAARTYIQPEKLVTLVVGNMEAIQPPLSRVAPEMEVTIVDISIPDP